MKQRNSASSLDHQQQPSIINRNETDDLCTFHEPGKSSRMDHVAARGRPRVRGCMTTNHTQNRQSGRTDH